MFPIPWNFPFRKKNGNIVNIVDAMSGGGGGGSDLPDYGPGDAGKVLGVDTNGDLEWSNEVNSEIQTLTNEVRGNWSEGGKNLLPNTATTKTVSGVTFTKNSDGTITANGTATENIYFVIGTISSLVGSFVLNGCPTGGGGSTYRLYAYASGGGSTIASDYGAGDSFTLAESTNLDVAILLLNGQTVSNIVFKPMIRLASITDPTYQPYAMTNRELTEVNQIISHTITPATNYSFDGTNLKSDGRLIAGRTRFLVSATLESDAWATIGTINNFTPSATLPFQAYRSDMGRNADGYIGTDGTIHVYVKADENGKYFVIQLANFY